MRVRKQVLQGRKIAKSLARGANKLALHFQILEDYIEWLCLTPKGKTSMNESITRGKQISSQEKVFR